MCLPKLLCMTQGVLGDWNTLIVVAFCRWNEDAVYKADMQTFQSYVAVQNQSSGQPTAQSCVRHVTRLAKMSLGPSWGRPHAVSPVFLLLRFSGFWGFLSLVLSRWTRGLWEISDKGSAETRRICAFVIFSWSPGGVFYDILSTWITDRAMLTISKMKFKHSVTESHCKAQARLVTNNVTQKLTLSSIDRSNFLQQHVLKSQEQRRQYAWE